MGRGEAMYGYLELLKKIANFSRVSVYYMGKIVPQIRHNISDVDVSGLQGFAFVGYYSSKICVFNG